MPHSSPQLRGADPVNDELEVGYNASFEAKWHKAEIAGRAVMALFLLAALGGLLGRGPFSHHTVKSDGLSVDYEPIARYGTATQITIHLPAPPETLPGGQVRISVGDAIIEPMGLQRVVPTPLAAELQTHSIEYVFRLGPAQADGRIRFDVTPKTIGPVHLVARRADGGAVEWTQVVLP